MRLTSLRVASFRNIELAQVAPGRIFNLLYGKNGQGKTNFLESIFLLGNPRSFRSVRYSDLIREGTDRAYVCGDIESGGNISRVALTMETAGRRVEIDQKGIKKASELHGRVNVVIFSPDDTGMVKTGPESRRRYLDRVVYSADLGYLTCWHDYHRILKHRNQLLKCADRTGIDVWTEKLALSGAEVIVRRRGFVSQLNAQFQQHYRTISGGNESADVTYRPEGIGSDDHGSIFEELLQIFSRNSRKDELLGTTSAGPHRDDLTFTLDGRPLKSFGSQGQQKSFVLALKMAEMDNLQKIFGEPPLVLLDDLSSELDPGRTANLLDFLGSRDIQVFITTTEPSSKLMTLSECSVFRMENGNLTYEGTKTR